MPERVCPPFIWAWWLSLPVVSRLLGTPPPALDGLKGDRAGGRVPRSVAGPHERWGESPPTAR